MKTQRLHPNLSSNNLKNARDAWAKYDLEYRGKGVEVKSASYHQKWSQKKLSSISFGVAPTRAWDEESNTYETEAKRQAFVYVLCLLAEKNRKFVNPLDVGQWEFWVISTKSLNDRKRSQHSITYNSLIKEFSINVRRRNTPGTLRIVFKKNSFLLSTKGTA